MKYARIVLPVLFLLACSGSDDDDKASGTESDTGTETPDDTDTTDEELTWQEMNFDQRGEYMATVVMPAMQEEFANHDPVAFETITCGTCHGSGATDGSFAMPSDVLFPIDVYDYPQGPTVTFMENVVVPEMAALLNTEPFDPNTFEGFGCFGCHPAAM